MCADRTATTEPPAATSTSALHQCIAEWLARPATYAPRPSRVETVETHISRVFLADRFVYKLKKPVHFEFVDFESVQSRRQACEDEVRLNRRMAPDVYLAVLPIGLDRRGRPVWLEPSQASAAVDFVVKMRRLPAEATLERLIETGKLTATHRTRLAGRLAEFYSQASPLTLAPADYCQAIRRHVQANFDELCRETYGLDTQQLARIHAAQSQYLELAAELLAARVADGRVIDGHGDLRPEHVVLTDPPVVFDCVEFNAEFRRVDVLDELCFLAMECDRLGAAEVGDEILAVYAHAGSDAFGMPLAAFYKCYRACVRAKVAALRSAQTSGDPPGDAASATRYLQLAEQYCRAFHQPLLLVTSGLMGTGKSTLAEALSQRLGSVTLRTDEVRRRLFGTSPQPAGFEQGHYTQQAREAVYNELFARAADALGTGQSVVLDGAFLTRDQKQRAWELARRFSATTLLLECDCPRDEAQRRIAARLAQADDPSEARPELYDQQKRAAESPPTGMATCRIDTTAALAAQLRQVTERLRAVLRQNPPSLPG